MESEELWKDIKGFEGKYQISNTGQVKSLSRIYGTRKNPTKDVIRKLVFDTDGYLMVSLPVGNSRIVSLKIHQLVAKHFVDGCIEGLFVCHRDGNKLNNNSTNLYFGNHTANVLDRYKHKTTRLTVEQVLYIRNSKEFYKDLAEKFGIPANYVNRIRSGSRCTIPN